MKPQMEPDRASPRWACAMAASPTTTLMAPLCARAEPMVIAAKTPWVPWFTARPSRPLGLPMVVTKPSWAMPM